VLMDPSPTLHEPAIGELLNRRPSGHTAGLLDRRYLSSDETVLYETRPSFVGYVLPGVFGAVLAAILLWLFLVVVTQAGGFAGAPPWVVPLVEFLFVVIVLLIPAGAITRWWFTCYAITTTRILIKEGSFIRRIIDIPHQAIQSTMFEEPALGRSFGYGNLQFSSASVAGIGYSRLGSRPGVINWRATPRPLETRAYFEMVKRAKSV
jgi:membrane protein YdbS with pleckstrin-like domain